MESSAERILVVADPNLGEQVRARVDSLVRSCHFLTWRRGDRQGAVAARELILSQSWTLILSIYSDYILSAEELGMARFPLNIHPALPDCRGMGYDVLPLLERRGRCGASLHWMLPEVDAGRVIMTHSQALPDAWDYSRLRLANQAATLVLTEQVLLLWKQCRTPEQFDTNLLSLEENAEQWSGPYTSRKTQSKLFGEVLGYTRGKRSTFGC